MPKTRANRATKASNIVSISSGDHRSIVVERRRRLVEEHLPLVEQIAKREALSLPPCFELDDLIQTGVIGLFHAAMRYRPREHDDTPFSAFARKRIRGEIVNSVSRRHYTEATMEPISPVGIERSMGSQRQGITRDYLPDPEFSGLPHKLIPRVEPHMECTIDRKRLLERIRLASEVLTPLESRVLDVYYSPDMPSFEEVAELLGMLKWQVLKAHTEAIQKLRDKLCNGGGSTPLPKAA